EMAMDGSHDASLSQDLQIQEWMRELRRVKRATAKNPQSTVAVLPGFSQSSQELWDREFMGQILCEASKRLRVQFGHAGASANAQGETAAAKNSALRAAGAIVSASFDDLGKEIRKEYERLVSNGTIIPKEEVSPPAVPMDYSWARELGLIRKPASFMTSICDERGEELLYASVPITRVLEEEMGVGGVLLLLWFQKRLPDYAKAGKDLSSSLVSGLLTIGDRFSGAPDGAAKTFTEAFDKQQSAHQFVNEMRHQGKLIPGIGHRVKSINNPDKRVEILKKGLFRVTERHIGHLNLKKATLGSFLANTSPLKQRQQSSSLPSSQTPENMPLWRSYGLEQVLVARGASYQRCEGLLKEGFTAHQVEMIAPQVWDQHGRALLQVASHYKHSFEEIERNFWLLHGSKGSGKTTFAKFCMAKGEQASYCLVTHGSYQTYRDEDVLIFDEATRFAPRGEGDTKRKARNDSLWQLENFLKLASRDPTILNVKFGKVPCLATQIVVICNENPFEEFVRKESQTYEIDESGNRRHNNNYHFGLPEDDWNVFINRFHIRGHFKKEQDVRVAEWEHILEGLQRDNRRPGLPPREWNVLYEQYLAKRFLRTQHVAKDLSCFAINISQDKTFSSPMTSERGPREIFATDLGLHSEANITQGSLVSMMDDARSLQTERFSPFRTQKRVPLRRRSLDETPNEPSTSGLSPPIYLTSASNRSVSFMAIFESGTQGNTNFIISDAFGTVVRPQYLSNAYGNKETRSDS
ncbi:unnamed protein product, partial [Mesorhabditis belari]|uniref:Uncharacterized protein n=1 Tax=Mesorhabditis belari TaxID=2138241 RepID=A0AAF3EI53_9BILA